LLVLGFLLGVRLPPMKLVLLLGLVHLSLVHRRHTELLAFIAPILLAEPLRVAIGDAVPALPRRLPLRAYTAVAAVAVAILGTSVALGITRDNPNTAPAEALAEARAAGLNGHVLNAYDFGGYLIFSGIEPFVDGRIDMYGDAFIRDYADAMGAKGDALPRLLDRYQIQWTLLQPSMQAVEALDRLSSWQRIYADDHAVVHRRISR